MKKLICVLVLCFLVVAITGCATIYSGWTNIRIVAKKFKAQCGPFNSFEGDGVDAIFTRQTELTVDKKRKLKDHPDVKMTHTGEDSTFEVK